jgi:hypothetical protein
LVISIFKIWLFSKSPQYQGAFKEKVMCVESKV